MTNKAMQVMIIGAGTGGLALAHGLKTAGIPVRVFERDRTPDAARGGYRVGISPAGSQSLKACVPADIYDLFVATCARAPRYFNMLTEQLTELVSLESQQEDPVHSEKNVNRLTLRNVLLTGLNDIVAFDKKFIRYDHQADGTIAVFFEDGTHTTGDILIGADGAGSRVCKQRLPQARQEETGMWSLGGKVPMTAVSKALLSDKMFHGMSLIMAPKGFGAIIHCLEFPWNNQKRGSDTTSRPDQAVRQSHAWSQETTADFIGWGLWASRKKFPKDPMTLSGSERIRLALELTRTWHPRFRELIRLTDPTTPQFINIRTSIPIAPWNSSQVTVLGDAIHTMTPGKGAGANTALRDAALLLTKLTEVHRSGTSVVDAIHDYEAEMVTYSTTAVLESRKQMNAHDLIHKPIIGRIQLAFMRLAMRIINVVPALKRRVTVAFQRSRAPQPSS